MENLHVQIDITFVYLIKTAFEVARLAGNAPLWILKFKEVLLLFVVI
jgi:hypothetical protein